MSSSANKRPSVGVLLGRHVAGAILLGSYVVVPYLLVGFAGIFGSWIQFGQAAESGRFAGIMLAIIASSHLAFGGFLASRRLRSGGSLVPFEWVAFSAIVFFGWIAVLGFLAAFGGGVHAVDSRLGLGYDVMILVPIIHCCLFLLMTVAGGWASLRTGRRTWQVIAAGALFVDTVPVIAILVGTWAGLA